MSNDASSLQTEMLLLTPAFGAVVWETVTVAEADGQGAVPGTVYV